MNVFNANMVDEPPVTLGVRGGRTTRSSRGRGQFNSADILEIKLINLH